MPKRKIAESEWRGLETLFCFFVLFFCLFLIAAARSASPNLHYKYLQMSLPFFSLSLFLSRSLSQLPKSNFGVVNVDSVKDS